MMDERETKAGLTERAHHAGDDKPAAPRKRRMSAKRKQEAVLRILRGEDLDLVSREIGATAAELSAWRDGFLEAGAASLKSRPEDGRELTCLKPIGYLVANAFQLIRPQPSQPAIDAALARCAVSALASGRISDIGVVHRTEAPRNRRPVKD